MVQATPMEDFLELVACDPCEVMDVPPERVGLPAGAIPAGAEVEAGRQFVVYFGKHKGQMLQDIPSGYLQWSLEVRNPSKPLRKFQEKAKLELRRRQSTNHTRPAIPEPG